MGKQMKSHLYVLLRSPAAILLLTVTLVCSFLLFNDMGDAFRDVADLERFIRRCAAEGRNGIGSLQYIYDLPGVTDLEVIFAEVKRCQLVCAPFQTASGVFLLLFILPVIMMAIQRKESLGGASLIQFVLYGNWMRGLNMFSVSAILFVVVFSFVIILLCNAVLSLIAGIAGRNGETICRLLYSLCRYAVIIIAVYYVFEYLGINLATYFAGVGVLSLAISMGSRDMVADIMSGIMILFEHQFQVGDYVELDSNRGKVLEMGIRSTKLLTVNNDIKYISNSYIRTVTNKSKNASPCVTELVIVSNDTIEAVEEQFRKALKEIGLKNKKIVGDLALVGITRVTGGGGNNAGKVISMRIRCECKERDYDDVRDFINRELYLYCEKQNIEIK